MGQIGDNEAMVIPIDKDVSAFAAQIAWRGGRNEVPANIALVVDICTYRYVRFGPVASANELVIAIGLAHVDLQPKGKLSLSLPSVSPSANMPGCSRAKAKSSTITASIWARIARLAWPWSCARMPSKMA